MRRRPHCASTSHRSSRPAAPNRAEDMISLLAEAEIDGEKLTDEEIFSFLRLLLPAGVETTYRSLGNLLFALLSDTIAVGRGSRRPLAAAAGHRGGGALESTAADHHPHHHLRHRTRRGADSRGVFGVTDARFDESARRSVGRPGRVQHLPHSQGKSRLGPRGPRLSRHAPRAARDAHGHQPSAGPLAQPADGPRRGRSAHPRPGVPLADVAAGAVRPRRRRWR